MPTHRSPHVSPDDAPPRPLRDLGQMRSMTVPGEGPNVAQVGRVIPIPDVPVEPVLSFSAFRPSLAPQIGSVLDAGRTISFVTGRTAIAKALECMEIEEGATILIPAYHCMSMVEPLSYVGATPRFYRIKSDFSIDTDDIIDKLDADVAAIMVTHYFGFPQAMPKVREICDRHGILLLEDCAHCFFGDVHGRPPGGWGDYAIASQRKFFPIYDGGLLISRLPQMSRVMLHPQSPMENLRAAYNLIETAVRYGRLRLLAPFMRLLQAVRGSGGGPVMHADDAPSDQDGEARNPAKSNSGGAGGFSAAWVNKSPTIASRLIFAATTKRWTTKRRRTIYMRFAAAFAGLPGCTVLKPKLPPNVVPYTFPLRVDALDEVFPELEDAAIPLQRFGQFLWPGVDETVCRTSADLSHHALQISCHQEMTDSEVASIIARFRYVLEKAARKPRPVTDDPMAAPEPKTPELELS